MEILNFKKFLIHRMTFTTGHRLILIKNDRRNSGGTTKGKQERKKRKRDKRQRKGEKQREMREKESKREKKEAKERKGEKKMSRVNYCQSAFNSQKEKQNILAEMLKISKKCFGL